MPKNEMTQEVEKRALLKQSEYDSILKELKKLNAKFVKQVKVNDVYFCLKGVKSFSEVEMDDIGSFSLRLREQAEGRDRKVTLNVKVITQEKDHNSWEEHETELESAEEVENILGSIGFKPFCTIRKARKMYKLSGISIILENIEGFGLGVEAEVITSREKGERAKVEIDAIFRKLGISDAQVVPKSITNLIMKINSKF